MSCILSFRKLLTLSFIFVLSESVSAQTMMGKAAQMLWYSGTRINDSTLITKKGHQVNYSRKRGQIKVKLKKENDPFSPYLEEVDKTSQRKKSATQMLMQQKTPVAPAAIIMVNQELDRVAELTRPLRNTTVQMDVVGSVSTGNSQENISIPEVIKDYYAEVMAFIEKSVSQNDLNPPPPPDSDFDYCWECDSSRQQSYRRQEQKFYDDYLGEEVETMRKLTTVWSYLGSRDTNKQLFTPEEKSMEQGMGRAMSALIDRWKTKVKKVWIQYSDDARKLPFLNNLVLGSSRQFQLLGFDDTDFITFSEVASKMEKVAETFLTKAINEKDYKIILNTRWIIGLFRQSELLGGSLSKKLDKTVYDIAQLTKFKVSLEAKAKISAEGTHQMGEMKGENYFCAVPDSNCVLQWILVEPDIKKMKYTLEHIEMVVPENKPTYAGTKNWWTGPADIRLDFCKEERDTALLFSFHPDGKELWNMPQVGTVPMGVVSTLFNHCFMDVERMKKMATEVSKEKLISDMMEKYNKNVKPNETLMNKDPSQMTPEEMKKLNEMLMASREISAMVQTPSPYSYLLKGSLRNRNALVFEETIDAKELFPQNTAIEYGTLKVKIEHAKE